MNKLHYYQVFNLILGSEVILRALPEISGTSNPDIRIVIGNVPETLPSATRLNRNVFVNQKELLIRIENVAGFYVRNGDVIHVEPLKGYTDDHAAAYILGTCIGVVMQQRGIISMHGSCVYKDGKAVLFSGMSGAGKSTTAQAFIQNGWKLVTDDVSPIRIIENKCFVLPGIPAQKLWNDAIDHADADIINVVEEAETRTKFAVDSRSNFQNEAVELTAVFLLVKSASGTLNFHKPAGMESIQNLMENVYRKKFLPDPPSKQRQLDTCVKIAETAEVYRIERPSGEDTRNVIYDYLIHILEENSNDQYE